MARTRVAAAEVGEKGGSEGTPQQTRSPRGGGGTGCGCGNRREGGAWTEAPPRRIPAARTRRKPRGRALTRAPPEPRPSRALPIASRLSALRGNPAARRGPAPGPAPSRPRRPAVSALSPRPRVEAEGSADPRHVLRGRDTHRPAHRPAHRPGSCAAAAGLGEPRPSRHAHRPGAPPCPLPSSPSLPPRPEGQAELGPRPTGRSRAPSVSFPLELRAADGEGRARKPGSPPPFGAPPSAPPRGRRGGAEGGWWCEGGPRCTLSAPPEPRTSAAPPAQAWPPREQWHAKGH